MKRILSTTICLLLLVFTATAQKAQQLKIYQKGGVVDTLRLSAGLSISHSRIDPNGELQTDFVMMHITTDSGERQYLIAQLDSMVLPNGKRVVFNGSMLELPTQAKPIGDWGNTDAWQAALTPRRSSFKGTFPGTVGTGNVTFFWTENDRIRLDAGYESRAESLTNDKTGASFVFDGADLDAASYTVYYPGKSVTIPTVQTQVGANNSDHIGSCGDCGTATATQQADGSYSFTLRHKATYLCFLPHIDYLPSAKITKIELEKENSNIAGTYQLTTTGLYNETQGSRKITLNLQPKPGRELADFFIGHDVNTEQDMCAAYMVIKPQSAKQNFIVSYYVVDTLSHIEKVFRQRLNPQVALEANKVYPITFNISDKEFRSIDMGLSVNWSNVNTFATEPSKPGSSYVNDDEANAALLTQSVVTQWLMPTDKQKQELIDKCQWVWGSYNGVTGYLVTAPSASKEDGNVHRIFLPCSSESTPAACLAANSRPVEALMIDMGLSVKWASRNLGATAPEGYGDYYAWGETETKTIYTQDTYLYNANYVRNIGNDYDINGTEYDAAFVNWGGVWRMPTKDEMNELLDAEKCEWTWTTIGGVAGYKISSLITGNSIFLPAAGTLYNMNTFYNRDNSNTDSNRGSYPTSLQGGDKSEYAWVLAWNNTTKGLYNVFNTAPWGNNGQATYRHLGHPVRAVAGINAEVGGMTLNVHTDNADWKLDDTQATIHGTLSSVTPIEGEVTVGFVIGEQATVTKANAVYDKSQTVSVAGGFSATVPVHDNFGYWYRAYVQKGDDVVYGDARHYAWEMVDLGLSVKWANMNVGASKPSEIGGYYAWGETATKDNYTGASYQYGSNYNKNLGTEHNIADTKWDAAHVNMGNAWHMPTQVEMEELLNEENCEWIYSCQDNMTGYKVVSKHNGNSIFLPAAGVVNNALNYSNRENGYGSYPSANQAANGSNMAYTLCWNNSGTRDVYNVYNTGAWGNNGNATERYKGRPVRAVAKPNAVAGGKVMHVRTDEDTWQHGSAVATLRGTLSSTTAIEGTVTVGFLVGETANIDKDNYLYDYSQAVSADGQFTKDVEAHNQFGYYYRAYVKVGDNYYYGDVRHYGLEMIDLGLSVKWANLNVGANSVEEYGGYYAWGETEPKAEGVKYDNSTYQHIGKAVGPVIAGSEYDAATVNMGVFWATPTKEQCSELLTNCDWTAVSVNGIDCFKGVSQKNGAVIYLPREGYRRDGNRNEWNSENYNADAKCFYMTSTPNSNDYYYMRIQNATTKNVTNTLSKYYGTTVRAVINPNVSTDSKTFSIRTDEDTWQFGNPTATLSGVFSTVTALTDEVTVGFFVGEDYNVSESNHLYDYSQTVSTDGQFTKTVDLYENMGYWYRAYVKVGDTYYCGDVKHYGLEMVDLGLPSGLKWANMNVGANNAEEFGDYLAWGETTPKDVDVPYDNANYRYKDVEIGSDISGTQYDAATVRFGQLWRTPSMNDCIELIENCDWTEVTYQNVACWKVTSRADSNKFIYLPKAGRKDNKNLGNTSHGLYMTSTRYNSNQCNDFYLQNGDKPHAGTSNNNYKYYGMSVRPVSNVVGTVGSTTAVHVSTTGCNYAILGDEAATLSGAVMFSGPVEDAVYGFAVGNRPNVDAANASTVTSYVTADNLDSEHGYSAAYAHDGSVKFFRAYVKVGDNYYQGDVKSITAADMLDVVFCQDGSAFNGAFTNLPVIKGGSPTVTYNEIYKRYLATFTGNTWNGNSNNTPNFYSFQFEHSTDFQNKLADGCTVETVMMLSIEPTNNNETDAFASYQNGGLGIGVKSKKIHSQVRIDNSYKEVTTDVTPVSGLYYHVVSVWDKAEGKLKVYINGGNSGEVSASGNFTQPYTNSRYYVVGGNPSAAVAEYGWTGNIVVARVYDKPLSADEVYQLYTTLTK